jgi:prevent-host-death family protein
VPFAIRYDRVAVAELKDVRGADRASITRTIREQLTHAPTARTRRKKEIVRETGERVWQRTIGEYRVFYGAEEARRAVMIRRVLYKGSPPEGGHPVKLIGIREARERLSAMVTRAQRERVVLTRHGRPAALLIGIEGEDLEEVLLRTNEEFWSELAEQRGRNDTLSEAEAMRALKLPAPPKPNIPRRARRRGASK